MSTDKTGHFNISSTRANIKYICQNHGRSRASHICWVELPFHVALSSSSSFDVKRRTFPSWCRRRPSDRSLSSTSK